MKILIVEDKERRAAEIASCTTGHDMTYSQTAHGAREAMHHKPDIVAIDHDLDLDGALLLSEVGSGMDVVVEIEHMHTDDRPLVIIHSKNPAASVGMVARLSAIGCPVAWIPVPTGTKEAQLAVIAALTRGWETR
jgi:DNA-binding response OmpR family regulator